MLVYIGISQAEKIAMCERVSVGMSVCVCELM